MTDGSASKSREMVASGNVDRVGARRSALRRSADARWGAFRDFARERRWTMVIAALVVVLSGAGVAAGFGSGASERAEALEKSMAEREKRVAELDLERKRREDQLAELQKRLNAKESQIAETEERATELEKRRDGLQKQVAELVAPVAPGGAERVADVDGGHAARTEIGASSTDNRDMPPDESADASLSTASVDATETEARPERIRAASRADAAGEEPSDVAYSATREPVGAVRVFIHIRAADPAARERAAAVAAELRRRGVDVAQIRGVSRPVRRDAVRFFYDQDRGAISALQDAVRSASPRAGSPVVNDFRSYGAPPRRGTIELWLS